MNETDRDSFGLLIWGGRWINFAWISIATVQAGGGIHIEVVLKIPTRVEDWILDVQFRPCERPLNSDDHAPPYYEAVLVTAHNAILSFHISSSDSKFSIKFKPLVAGLRTVLYSAHIVWEHYGQLLVAAGTVSGEAILFSVFTEGLLANSPSQPFDCLYHRFAGHEGSIFGIRISDKFATSGLTGIQRVLATCSDDRTIRVWDVSDLRKDIVSDSGGETRPVDFSHPPEDHRRGHSFSKSIAKIRGHASRIWGLRFLPSNSGLQLLSLGEDSTAQLWHLCEELVSTDAIGHEKPSSRNFKCRESYDYHTGKSIWSATVFKKSNGFPTGCTGGADGRIVAYDINANGVLGRQESFLDQWSMVDVLEPIFKEGENAEADKHDSNGTISKRIFDALAGNWTVNRSIKSALPTYPSGSFEGTASFESRPPTADTYDAEYLYVENGQFNAEQGLSFQATRRYVYRFQELKGVMSAWFARTDDNSGVDYLFHDVEFDSLDVPNLQDPKGKLSVKAKGYHLCVKDHYTPRYVFSLTDGPLTDWSLAYTVKGPQKDYLAEASYARQANDFPDQDHKQKKCVEPKDEKEAQRLQSGTLDIRDSFKSYSWTDRTSILMTTAQGRVILGKVQTEARPNREDRDQSKYLPVVAWQFIGAHPSLKSASVISKGISADCVFLSGNDGTTYQFKNADRSFKLFTKLPGKVAFLHNFKTSHIIGKLILLATCLGSPVAYVCSDESIGLNKKEIYLLALPESFVVTSACYEESLGILILGSRNGALAVYETCNLSTEHTLQSVQHLTGIHGEEAITSIVGFPGYLSESGAYFLTSGRDGKFSVHRFSCIQTLSGKRGLKFATMHQSTPPLGPNIEGAAFDMTTQDLSLWGFQGKRFIVWNASKDMVTMTVECGGAHRSWSYSPLGNGSGGGAFVWTKASKCYLRYELHPSHRIFQRGGHGREIKAVAVSPPLASSAVSTQRYLATGAEDTDIRLFSYNSTSGAATGLRCLVNVTKHTTGIQQLRWSSDGQLLFSAAGCEEFFVWRVHQIPLLGVRIICEAVCPTVSEDGDLRIMDFDVHQIESALAGEEPTRYLLSLVFSDSSIRVSSITLALHTSH